jgi:hypothetical protein
MTVEKARAWLIVSSLLITGVTVLFLFVAPVLGYPLRQEQALRIVQIVMPVFVGYLGSAAHFVFREREPDESEVRLRTHRLAELLLKGPVIVWGGIMFAAIVAFGVSNRPGAPPGSGWSVDDLAAAVTGGLSLLAVTTNVAVAYLFGVKVAPNDRVSNDAG